MVPEQGFMKPRITDRGKGSAGGNQATQLTILRTKLLDLAIEREDLLTLAATAQVGRSVFNMWATGAGKFGHVEDQDLRKKKKKYRPDQTSPRSPNQTGNLHVTVSNSQSFADLAADDEGAAAPPAARVILVAALLQYVGEKAEAEAEAGDATSSKSKDWSHSSATSLTEGRMRPVFQTWKAMISNLDEAHLEGACLEGAQLQSARLERAHLEEANLIKANLHKAHLPHAMLNDAWVKQADLRSANLDEVSFVGAVGKSADLTSASLENAIFGGEEEEDSKTDFTEVRVASFLSVYE